MRRERFTPKIGKLSFIDVAKKSGLPNFNSIQKKKAVEALHQAGYGPTDAKRIVGGYKKMEKDTLKRVFKVLNKEKVVAKGSTTVDQYVKAEKGRQSRIYHTRMALRAKELEEEKKLSTGLKKDGSISEGEERKDTSTHLSSDPVALPKNNQENEASEFAGFLAGEQVDPVQKQADTLKPQSDPEIDALRKQAEHNDLPID